MTETYTPEQQARMEEESIGEDVRKAVAKFIDHWKAFVLAGIVALSLAFLYMRYATRKYKIDASLMIQDPDKGGNLLGSSTGTLSDFQDLLGAKSNVDNEAQVLQTKDLSQKVVKDLKLYLTYYAAGRFNSVELYRNNPLDLLILSPLDSLYSTKLRLTVGTQQSLQVREETDTGESDYTVYPGAPFRTAAGDSAVFRETGYSLAVGSRYVVGIQDLADAGKSLQGALSVDIPNKEVTTINLEMTNSIPARGVAILGTLINEYIRGNINQKNAFADSTIGFINNEISVVDAELTGIEERVQLFKESNHIADITEQSKAVIDNSSSDQRDLNQALVQQQVIQSTLAYLKDDRNARRVAPAVLTSTDPTFPFLMEKYNSLQVELDKLSEGSTSENPNVINLEEQISNLRKDLITNMQNQLSAINISIDRLQAQNNLINNYIQSAPEKQRLYMGLSREQDIKQALFIYLLQKKEEVAVEKASNISSCVVIDSPRAARQPYFPRKLLVFVVAILAALAIPYGILLLTDALNNKIKGPADIAHTGVTLLGEIGHNPLNSPLVFREKSRSIIAEQFRGIRTNLQFALEGAEHAVVMVTSSMAGEGKSFIAVNLALAYASNGKKVLLVDLDLRKPRVTAMLDIHKPEGFSNYIVTHMNVDEVIIPVPDNPMLDVLPSGTIPPNPAELLAHPKTQELFRKLRERYDVILVDSAPVGLVTDAQLIAAHADTTVFVIRQGYTYKQQANIIGDLRKSGKILRIYAVLNDARRKASSRYGYDYSQYGYGPYGGVNGYYEKEKKGWGRNKEHA